MIKLPCYLTGFSSKTDGSASLRFATQEISGEEFKDLKNNLNNFGWLLFSEQDITSKDIPTERVKDGRKSQAQRLRAVLYKIHEGKGGLPADFDAYYEKETEKIISFLKEKID